VSAASIWEISIKASLGKLKADPEAILASVEPAGFSLLPVTAEHAVRVFSLGLSHGDPFDRLLATQAQLEGMTLLTRDEALLACGPWVSLAD
jgi:PIN domain nuclease of toxin-antitoxin system